MSLGFHQFTPEPIKWQNNFIYEFFNEMDWSQIQEIMLSGAVGSAKTTAAAWIAIHECMSQKNVNGLIARKTLPDLKKTLFMEIWEMLDATFKEGRDFQVNETQATIWFPKTKSQLLPGYWRDKRYKKFRSLPLSFAMIEELTENNDEDKQAYDEIMLRIGRRPAARHFMLTMTNPDAPTSWQYKHFIEGKKKVYYSVTEDNPFLDPRYVAKLKKDLPPAMADRMLRGMWTEINKDKIYYAYDRARNFKPVKYKIDPAFPVTLCFDFNIADGKPMSSCAYQYINDHFHVFDQAIVEGARTLDIMDEWLSKGILDKSLRYIIHGDATGQARDTRSILSDYQIITKFLQQNGFQFALEVPRANPPIRDRHNRVNAYLHNDLGQVRMTIYEGANKVDEGLRLTSLKKGGQYIEDDSKDYQHVTTALGYGVIYDTNRVSTKTTSQRRN